MTVNGTIEVARPVYAVAGGGTLSPLDGWLGVAWSSVSVGARELCCRLTLTGGGFKKAAANLTRLAQIAVGHERLRAIAEAEGRAVLAGASAGTVGPDWTAEDCRVRPGGPTRLMVGADGVMVPVITAAEKAKRRANRRRGGKSRRRSRVRGADQRYKEFKIGTFYDQSREHQYAFGTAGDSDALGRRWRREAAKVHLGQAQETIAVSDGAEWIQEQLRTRLPMVQVRILDYFHLLEHVGAAAAVCFGEGSVAAGTWRGAAAQAVNEEGGGGLLVQIVETRRQVRTVAKREVLRKLEQYVAKRVALLDYPAFRAAGFDLGSGPTEAFCKTLTARLKGSGMRWDRPNAEAIMALAALDHSHLWRGYWTQQRQNAA